MIDIASFVLCGFQDMIVSAFGSSLGWLVGHLIVLGPSVPYVQNFQ